MVNIDMEDMSYTYLLQLLKSRYEEADAEERRKLNSVYKQLQHKSETWLSQI